MIRGAQFPKLPPRSIRWNADYTGGNSLDGRVAKEGNGGRQDHCPEARPQFLGPLPNDRPPRCATSAGIACSVLALYAPAAFPSRGLLISELVWSKPRPAAARFGGPTRGGARARQGRRRRQCGGGIGSPQDANTLPAGLVPSPRKGRDVRGGARRANAPWCGGQIEMKRPRPHSGPHGIVRGVRGDRERGGRNPC